MSKKNPHQWPWQTAAARAVATACTRTIRAKCAELPPEQARAVAALVIADIHTMIGEPDDDATAPTTPAERRAWRNRHRGDTALAAIIGLATGIVLGLTVYMLFHLFTA